MFPRPLGCTAAAVLPKQDSETSRIQVNPTQVREEIGHPVYLCELPPLASAHAHLFERGDKVVDARRPQRLSLQPGDHVEVELRGERAQVEQAHLRERTEAVEIF